MTHDELLDRLNRVWDREPDETQWELIEKLRNALRAVVELAATYKDGNYVNEEFNQGLQTAFQLIIEAIEKELS
jgi:ribosome-associated translation inhibitor RaiA